MPSRTIIVRLSESCSEFLAAALDLLQEVEDADEVLVAGAILAAAADLRSVIEARRGTL